MNDLETRFRESNLLSKEAKKQLIDEIKLRKPEFAKPFFPRWWWWKRCNVKVLLVTDGSLNFGDTDFGLSKFLSAFTKLQSTTWNNYQITLGYRPGSTVTVASTNPLVVGAPILNFNFQTSVNLADFDQVWLFGISNGANITANEVTAIETYMNGGGGLFATGDHGSLGRSMCGNIPRVKDMRIWDNTNANNDLNEVSMNGARRNDTNRPSVGQASSTLFSNQSDNIPQNIAVRTFGSGTPHPLLSIKPSLRPSGIIDIMPDHPHEGECRQETIFTVNRVAVPTQIIATSFVPGGNTAAAQNKHETIPHCFPSISVWDGRLASVGRIVVDSTWHHFVNVNLVGGQFNPNDGLLPSDIDVIIQYYMNISLWISRKKSWLCWRKWFVFDLLIDSQVIEASLNNPNQKLQEISLADLSSIGGLVEEELGNRFNPVFARTFIIDIFEDFHPELSKSIDVFRPADEKANKKQKQYNKEWINTDLILHTAIGSAFIELRDQKNLLAADVSEKDVERINEIFIKGLAFGYNAALENLNTEQKELQQLLKSVPKR